MISQKLRQILKEGLFRSFLRVRLTFEEECRQPHFSEFIWVFDTDAQFWHFRNKGKWVCQGPCYKGRMCVYGPQQGYACLAYWRWHIGALCAQTRMLATIPLEDVFLQYLTHMQLLGIFYVRQFSLRTVADFSKVGLRSRLLAIAEAQKNEPLTSP